MELEDVLEVKNQNIQPTTPYGENNYRYKGVNGVDNLPYVWFFYERGDMEKAEKNRSIAYELVDVDAQFRGEVLLTEQKPYCTYWGNNGMNEENNWKSGTYHKLVTRIGEYWLSTRLGYPDPNYPESFRMGLHRIESSGIAYCQLQKPTNGSSASHYSGSYKVRPIIEIPLNKCIIKEASTEGMDFEINIKNN